MLFCAQADVYLLQVDVHIASTCAAAGSHSQKRESRVPGQLRGRAAALRGLDAVVKIHRHVPLPLPCVSDRHRSRGTGMEPSFRQVQLPSTPWHQSLTVFKGECQSAQLLRENIDLAAGLVIMTFKANVPLAVLTNYRLNTETERGLKYKSISSVRATLNHYRCWQRSNTQCHDHSI